MLKGLIQHADCLNISSVFSLDFVHNRQHVCKMVQADISKEESKIALMAALLLPLRALQSTDKKGKAVPVVPIIVGESIKWKKAHATHMAELQKQAPELLQVYQSLQVLLFLFSGSK